MYYQLCLALSALLYSLAAGQNVDSLTSDDLFVSCCRRQSRIADGCYKYCDYDSFAKKGLTTMYLNSDPSCSRLALGSYLYCAGSGRDHRAECSAVGVGNSLAGPLCTDLCDMRPGTVLELGWQHLPCWSVLDRVKTVFKAYADEKAQPQPGIEQFFG